MPTEIEKLEKKIKEEEDPEIKAKYQEKLDGLKGDEPGDWTPIGDVTQEAWDNVKGRRVKGSFPADFGIAEVFNEKNIACSYVLDESAPFIDQGLIFLPISKEAAFKSMEIVKTLGVPYKVADDGRILLRSIEVDGKVQYPDFAGKRANVIYGQQVKNGVPQTFPGSDGKLYPSIGGLSVAPLASAEIAEDLGL